MSNYTPTDEILEQIETCCNPDKLASLRAIVISRLDASEDARRKYIKDLKNEAMLGRVCEGCE